MELTDIDLNLLKPLHALLTERSVTRAAHRLGLSQPAMSAALRRLRHHFNDPLLVRAPGGHELTGLGESLRARTADALVAVEQALAVPSEFNPRTSARHFRIVASEYAIAVLGGPLLASLRRAPGVMVEFHQLTDAINDEPEATLRGADLVVFPRGYLDGFPSADLWQDRWICLLGGNDTRPEPTTDDLLAMRWVAAHHGSGTPLAAVARLAETGHDIRISMMVQSHLALPLLLRQCEDVVALVQERLVSHLPPGSIRATVCPIPIPELHEAMWWHPAHEHDAGNRWLRALVADAARVADATSHGPRHLAHEH
ncbi:LysR family transcriptional regulator [Actinoplanes sp. CA-131856]